MVKGAPESLTSNLASDRFADYLIAGVTKP